MERCSSPLTFVLAVLATVQAVTRPPGIVKQADFDTYYKAGETVKVDCEAVGTPNPTYRWTVNKKEFNPSGNDARVVQLANKGTIVFSKPEDKDEGIYQCKATNDYGTSLSIKFNLREAKLKDFEVQPRTHADAILGRNLTLNCVPPESVPPANVFWIIKQPYGGYDVVNYDARVSMDHENRLRFTNVKRSDLMGGAPYACMAMNGIMRKSTQGPEHVLRLTSGNEEMRTVGYMWASPEDHLSLRGDDARFKCIFAGNPTPDVHWVRTDGAPLSDRAQIRSFGQELLIENVDFGDVGTYECWGTNSITHTRVQRTISLRVQSRPYWLREPKDVEVVVGGTAEFTCMAKAVPEPRYFWFINGVPLEEISDDRITPDRFKRQRPDHLLFSNLNREDSMVIQCNATNKHGYIWGDVYLNVLSEAPTIIQPPDNRKVVAEGTSLNMTCRVTGKPDPIITWFKDDQQITGGRYRTQPNGDLYTEHVVLSDAGLYRCEAENKFNKTSRSGLLLVRRKTQIEQAPMDLEITSGYNAKFTCSATTDPEEVGTLEIKWLKDNKEISTVVQRMFTNIQDNSLTISGTIVRDSGSYTCIATNGLDAAKASAMLTVRDKPDAPSNVRIDTCRGRTAIVVWTPGSYNNAPVQYFLVQYNTTFNPDTWTFAERVDSIYSTANISLSPWVNYTFRVIAYNKIGESDPSFPTPTVCKTMDTVPGYNPRNLRTIGDENGKLHVEWTPMPPIEHNGEGFVYELQTWQEGYEDKVITQNIQNWTIHDAYQSTGGQVYEPYYILLRAQNSRGYAQEDPTILRGFTYEDIPSVTCSQPSTVEVGDTYAELKWEFDYNQINTTRTALNGEFRGFKVQFWQNGNRPDTLREWDVTREEALASRVGTTFRARVEHLLPFTNMRATVAVKNNFFVSQPSDSVEFKTLPGFPGPVELLRPINIGDNHVNLEWKPPVEIRGDILGYDIGYQTVKGLDLGEMQERDPQVNDPYATTAILSGLLTNTRYRVHIWARTDKGRGESYFIELITSEAGDPQAPRFSITDVGQHHINVSWWINPYARSGTVVYVEYRKEDAAEWQRTVDEVISSWKNITDLEAGTTYELRVVATTGGVRRASSIEDVTTDGIALASALVGNYGWFVGMLLVVLLVIGLIVFFVVIYKRGTRFKERDTDWNVISFDKGSYSDTAPIPKSSSGFGSESKGQGFLNRIYDDDDKEYYDDEHDVDHHQGAGKNYDDEQESDDEGGFGGRHYDHNKHYDDRRNYDDRHHDDQHDDRRHDDRQNYDDRHHDDRRDHDDERNYDRDGRNDDKHYDDRRDFDDDRRHHDDREEYDDDDDRYTPMRHGQGRDGRHPDTSEDPYEEYERKPSGSYDPEYEGRDYREPHRFDRLGVPVNVRERVSSSKSSKNAGAASTNV
ncbi:neuroglian-like isoform X2 [Littorina saxatilis]|uniref:Uncharacterized protein n=1 Tax=Littorina saxatilis TaxID=31220 RepID=A0AAN9GBM5_9CAEN